MKLRLLLALIACLAVLASASPAQCQDKIQTSEFQVTFDSGGHSTPMIGKDSIGDLIVYSEYPVVNGVPGNASIYYQRVGSGAPFGPAVTVADSPDNQWLDDVSGDNIVYTLTSPSTPIGNIVLYQISTEQARTLTTAGNAWEPRIYGDYVVWVEINAAGAGQVVMYQISSGTPVQTTIMAGPSPSAADAAIGDRFVVWSQYVNGVYSIAAYDMWRGLSVFVASGDAQTNLRAPSTMGSWIAYESHATNGTAVDIVAINMDTNETRKVASNGSANQRPHISGDLLAYESNVLGNWQIFLYRLAEGDTFQVTSSTYDERLNDVLGNMATYIDSRNGLDGVFGSSLTFVPTQAVTLAPSPVNFGSVNVGASSSKSISLSINSDLTLSTVKTMGDFSLSSDSCAMNTPISGGTICTLQAQFTPTKPGQRWFPLVVTDSNSNRYSFGLQGTGVGSAVAITPGVISTVAGDGSVCSEAIAPCGDGGSATSAQLWGAVGVAVDSTGNLFIADWYENRIRKVDPSGIITTVAGSGPMAGSAGTGFSGDGGPATAAQLSYPSNVAVDSAGNLYIADQYNHRIRKVDTNGIISTVAGNGSRGYSGDNGLATGAGLYYPTAVAIDTAGNLYIGDRSNRIRKVDMSGFITTIVGNGTAGYSGDNGPAISAKLNDPDALAVDGAGNLYIGDRGNFRVRKVDVSGVITTIAGDGTYGYGGDGGPAISAQLDDLMGVAVDTAGNVYISGYSDVRKVDVSGVISTVAGEANFAIGSGGDGGPATSAQFFWVDGVAVDGAENLYLADSGNNRIRKVDVSTSALTFGTLTTGQTSSVQSIALSNVGNAVLNFRPPTDGSSAFEFSSNFGWRSIDNLCGVPDPWLAIGATCDIGVIFAPAVTAPNSLSGTLKVNDDAFNTPQLVSLSGSLATPPVFTSPAPGSALATAEATGPGGAVVTFTNPSATTENNTPATVNCAPASGAMFALGQTTISCTASDPDAPSLTTSALFSVVVRDTTPPTLTVPANIRTDATTPNGAPVSYAPSATDVVDPHPTVSCTPASGSTFAIGTSTVTCMATDFSGNRSSGTFTVFVKAAAQQVTDLIALVNSFSLQQAQNGLDSKLQAAEQALTAANAAQRSNVCNAIATFIQKTNTDSSTNQITANQASQLLAAANRIQAVLACQ